MGSEYDLISMNISNCTKILNMPESAKIYPTVGKYNSICQNIPDCGQMYLNMSNVVNMAEYA